MASLKLEITMLLCAVIACYVLGKQQVVSNVVLQPFFWWNLNHVRCSFSQVRQTGDVAEWLPPKSLAMHRNNKNAVPLTFLEQFESIELPTVRTDYLCKHV
uniref:Putative secreted protein n=1 Tax=Amblyomma americanum TaxID=6943 RepID=A0A0C9S3F3_AMBAM